MLICKCGKVSDWSSIVPLCSLWPKPSVSNVTVKSADHLKILCANMIKLYQSYPGLKLVFRTSQYATMWLPLHSRVQY